MLRQRQPRIKNPKHLEYIRTLPCAICKNDTSTEAAHIRTGNLGWGKRSTGMAEKPDDKWAVPLCNQHHREQHEFGDELNWWASKGIDPFLLAISLRGPK